MTRGYWQRRYGDKHKCRGDLDIAAVDIQREDGFQHDHEESQYVGSCGAQQCDEHGIGEPAVLQLLAQNYAADEDKPRESEREEAGDQPAAEGEKLCLARIVELIRSPR